MRPSIPAGERLALTLRYLATGENFRSMQYLFRIPPSTISTIIPEVLDAIYKYSIVWMGIDDAEYKLIYKDVERNGAHLEKLWTTICFVCLLQSHCSEDK